MTFSLVVFASLPIVSTFLGGYIVYRWKRDLHPWLSLSGGILLGVAFLDLLPEAFEHGAEQGIDPFHIGAYALGAILVFHILDSLLGAHHHEHTTDEPMEPCLNKRHHHARIWLRMVGIFLHTFLDGVAIGAGFAANEQLGFVILTAVLLHDFSDGMSTVTILKGLKHHNRGILTLLALNALAPFLGAMIGFSLGLSESSIVKLLAIFSGFFITIALSELLPQAHAGERRRMGLGLTLLGIALVVVIRTLGHT